MNDDAKDADNRDAPTRFSLSRWSARKRAVARSEAADETPAAAAQPSIGVAAPAGAVAEVASAAPLPDVGSLTFDSDFTVFMNGKVDESVRRAALRTLLHDARFNVMDGLDVYIDDYSLPDPIPPSMLAELRHSIAVLNPVFPGAENAIPETKRDLPASGEPVPVSDTANDASAVDSAEKTEVLLTGIAGEPVAKPVLTEDGTLNT